MLLTRSPRPAIATPPSPRNRRRSRPQVQRLEDRSLLTTAATLPVTAIGVPGAVLHGTVNPEGTTAAVSFQYSTSPAFPAVVSSVGSGFSFPKGVATDGAGNVYVADTLNSAVKKMAPDGSVTTVGSGFSFPGAVAVDGAGNVYVADTSNNAVKKVTPGGAVSTVGSGFHSPDGVAVDASGNVYVAEFGASSVKVVHTNGSITTVGSGFTSPNGVAVDAAGNVFVADYGADAVKKVTPAGAISTIGSGFSHPAAVAVDAAGNVFVADLFNDAVKKVAPDGSISTVGSGFNRPFGVALDAAGGVFVADYASSRVARVSPPTVAANPPAVSGSSDTAVSVALAGLSPGTTYYVRAVAAGSGGAAFGATQSFTTLVPTTATTLPVTGVTGTGATLNGAANPGGARADVSFQYSTSPAFSPTVQTSIGSGFDQPFGVAVDISGNVYVADTYNGALKKVAPDGTVTTFPSIRGSITGVAVDASGNVFALNHSSDGVYRIAPDGTTTRIGSVSGQEWGVAVDTAGNVYVADTDHDAVLKIRPDGQIVTVGSGFNHPLGVAVDAAGNVYVADFDSFAVKKVTPDGTITNLGSGFTRPFGVAVDAAGNVYVADFGKDAVTAIRPDGSMAMVGSGFSYLVGVAVDAAGNVYASDINSNQVVRISPPSVAATPGVVSGTSSTTVSASLTGLLPGTTYYVRAVATGPAGTALGATQSFTTAAAPTVTAPTASGVASTTATLGGTVADDGGAAVTKRGVLYAPTSAGLGLTLGTPGVVEVDDAAGGTGVFGEALSGLSPLTSYSFVAFATNGAGTGYTSPVSTFETTEAPSLVVTTTDDSVDAYDGRTSLREAVTYAASLPGQHTVTFDPSFTGPTPKTITLTLGPIDLSDGFAGPGDTIGIQGPGSGVLTVSGGGASQVFVLDGTSASLFGLTVSGGSATNGGGLRVTGGAHLSMSSCVVTANTAGASGGGLYVQDSDVSLINTSVTANTATGPGGGLFVGGGSVLSIDGGVLASNLGHAGGGAFISDTAKATLTDGTVSGNRALGNYFTGYGPDAFGGGLAVAGSGSLELTDSTITGNTAQGDGGGNYGGDAYGGGISVVDSASLTLTGGTVRGNTARGGDGRVLGGTGYGGGIAFASTGSLTSNDGTISGNFAIGGAARLFAGACGGAAFGGGISASGSGPVTLITSTVSGNTAQGGNGDNYPNLGAGPASGGGISATGSGSLSLTDTTVSQNTAHAGRSGIPADANGGGIFASGTGYVALANCALSGNSAQGGDGPWYAGSGTGGGLDATGAEHLTLTNCTLSGNGASGPGSYYGGGDATGGGVAASATAVVAMTGCTFSGNYVSNGYAYNGSWGYGAGAAIFVSDSARVAVGNSIVGDSVVGSLDPTSAFNLLVGTDTVGGLADGSNGNQLVASADELRLAPLGNYGGPTQTIPLLPGSPALDAGSTSVPDASTTDQRGLPRVGAPDIGAFESQGFQIAVSGGDRQNARVSHAFASPLTVTVTANNPDEPVDGGTVAFIAPAAGASATLASAPATISGGVASTVATANAVVGGYLVTASLPGTGSHVAFAMENNSQPTFSNLHSAEITYGDASVTLSGTIADGSTPAIVNVYIYVSGNGITPIFASVGIQPDGTFTAVVPTAALPASPAGSPYTVRYDYDGPHGYHGTQDRSTTLTVDPKTLTVTAKNAGKLYGVPITFAGTEFTTSGLINSDVVTSATISSAGAAADAAVAGSPYAISIGSAVGTGLSNYTITYQPGQLNVFRRTLDVSVDSRHKTYGQILGPASFTGQVQGLLPSDGITVTFDSPLGDAATATVAGGPYAIVPVYHDPNGRLANYSLIETHGQLTIDAHSLTIFPGDVIKTYGQAVTFAGTEFTAVGLVNGDNVTSATLSSPGAAASATVAGSPYVITIGGASGVGLGNYNINYADGTLLVGKADLHVTADNRGKTYGQTLTPADYTGTLTGVTAGDVITASFDSLAGDPAGATVAGGPYPITGTLNDPGGRLTNYNVSYSGGLLVVSPRSLNVTAGNVSKTYGQAVSFLGTEFTTSGLINGDRVDRVSLASAGATANASVAGSPYAIVPSAASGAGLGNYNITYTNGTLAVGKASLAVAASSRHKTYGQTLTAADYTGTLTGVTAGDMITASFDSPTGDPAGASVAGNPYAIVPTLSDPGGRLANYTVVSTNGQLTVDLKALTVTANNASKTYGQTVTFSGTEFTTSGLINGDRVTSAVLSSPGTAASATVAGSPYVITIGGASGVGLGNYTITYVNGYLAVALPANAAYVLNPTASGAVNASGNATVCLSGGLYVASNAADAVNASGNAQVNVGKTLQVVGGVKVSGNASARKTGTPSTTADPYATLPLPSLAGLTNYGSVSVSGNNCVTLAPGVYTSIQVSGNGEATLRPGGVYIIRGGGLSVSGNGSLQGSGVTIVNVGSNYNGTTDGGTFGGVSLAGNGTVTLSGPVSGPYAGIVLFQPSSNSRPLALGGNAGAGISSLIEAPAAAVGLSGNARFNGSLVCNTLSLTGNAGAFQLSGGAQSDYGVSTSNWISNGVLTVSTQDDTGAGLDPQAVARLDDAMTYLNQALGGFGVFLSWAPAGMPADVRVHFAPTTPEGGAAQGVLGFTTPSNDVYFASGWDESMASDPAQVGPGQYDFLTLATHELAHTVGLGESIDPGSVMYEYLEPGVVRRRFTDVNLSLINTNADRFMRVGPSSPASTPTATPAGVPAGPMSTAQTWPSPAVIGVPPSSNSHRAVGVVETPGRGEAAARPAGTMHRRVVAPVVPGSRRQGAVSGDAVTGFLRERSEAREGTIRALAASLADGE